MSEALKTSAFVVGAVALVIAASVTQPENRTASVFSDEGEAFYPNFRDAQKVKAIEVVDYDESTAVTRPLKVELRNSRWLIVSNHDYPIDVGDRLVKTAAALVDLHKDRVKSDLVQDHGKYGVIDPLDQKITSLTGRGKRVTLRDAQKNVLADYILGKPVEGKAGWRYLRVPGGKRTYEVKTDADPSARFADWVNAGLLRMPSANIRKVTINAYSVNQDTGTLDQAERVVLTQDKGQWSSPDGTVKSDVARSLAAALDRLKIVDARPKPPEMAQDLRQGKMQLSMMTAVTLRQFGFLLTQSGRILASDGEMSVEMANGVAYQIRFGDVATTSSDVAKAAGADRYLFITTTWDGDRAAQYGDKSGAGERVSRDLNIRFADWFYTIANTDFQRLRVTKAQIVR
jgi:hypothetical protein